MKKVMFACGVISILFVACKKKELEIQAENQNQDTTYEFPTSEGSYWIYQWSEVDSTGVETALNQYDSLFVIGDSVINGNTYAVYRSVNFSGFENIYLQRDSSGFIVDNHGNVSFTYMDFDVIYSQGSEPGLWDYYSQYLSGPFTISLPIGTFQTIAAEHFIYSQNGSPINSCGDMEQSFKTYYASGVGQVLQETAFSSSYYTQCKKMNRTLIDYYIP